MIKQKYIGIENELISFKKTREIDFSDYMDLLRSKEDLGYSEFYEKATGNHYYVDISEIEIVTPPIAINEGFASRVTDSLIIGRNHVINSTPNLKHTGYSMHWNVSPECNHKSFYYDIAIPFQLFGLTPLSLGFTIRNRNSSNKRRYEILGDSLTNIDQIQATALLLGAYTLAKSKHDFPILISQVANKVRNIGNKQDSTRIDHMVRNGRYTILNIKHKNHLPMRSKETQAQNVLELFYEWLSPFVYQLGDRDEISNLEAFITGEKKLEIDDKKYFYMLQQNNGYDYGIYRLTKIITTDNFRSQILQDTPIREVPREGKLFGKIMDGQSSSGSGILSWKEILSWNNITLRYSDKDIEKQLLGLNTIYRFAEKISDIKYFGTKDTQNIKPKNIINNSLKSRLNSRIIYDPNKDNSAIITDQQQIEEFEKKYKLFE